MLRFFEERWNRHEPHAAGRAATRSSPDDVHGLRGRRSMLGRLSSEVDLHEQLRRGPGRGCRSVDGIEQPQAVYGMDGGDTGHGLANLVGLQRPDQMPSDLKVGRSLYFL